MSSSIVDGINVQDISKHLNCSVCNRLIRSPKLLPCLHSFCLTCIEDLASASDDGFSCPQCKTEAKVSKDEIQSLPTNFFLDNMLDLALMNSSDTEPVPCTNCDLNTTANSRCLDCGEFLCNDCYNVHKRIRQTKEHRIMTIPELLASTTGELLNRVAYCHDHGTEQLKYYCDSCNVAVCRDCLLIEHRQHKYNYIKEAKKVQKQKAAIEQLLEDAVVHLPALEKANSDVRHISDKLQGRLATVKSEIRDSTLGLMKVLKDREQALLAEAEKLYFSKSAVIDKQREELELEKRKFKTACEFTQQVLKYANEVEFLSLKEHIKNRLAELCETEPNAQLRENGILKYDIDKRESERTVSRALGRVKTYAMIIEQSDKEINGIENEEEVAVIPSKESDPISVELKDPSGLLVYPEVVNHDQKQASVRYSPALEGVFVMSVFSRGDMLSGFPLDINYTSGNAVSIPDPFPRVRSAKQAFVGSGSRFGKLSDPQDVAVDKEGHVIVCDSRNHRIQVFNMDSKFLYRFGSLGTDEGKLQSPSGVAVTPEGHIVVSDMINNRMQEFTIEGEFIRSYGASDDSLHHPSGVAVDSDGRVIVVDRGNARIVIYDSNGNQVTAFGSLGNGRGQFNCPSHVAINSRGHIIVSDFGNDRIQVFSSTGSYMFRFGKSGRGDGELNWPTGVAVNKQDQVIVCDSYNHRIQIYKQDGSFVSQFGSEGSKEGEFKRPEGIAVTDLGSIVIADWGNDRIQVF